jgi:PAS domain S-box-containing protein
LLIRPLRIPFGAKVNLAFIGGLLLVAAVGFLAYRSIGELVDTGRAEGRAFENTAQIERIFANLKSAESLQRKYLITGNPDDASAFASLRALVFAETSVLRGKVQDVGQMRRLDHLGMLIRERFELMGTVVRARRASGLSAAAAILRSQRNVELAQQIERLMDEFKEQESRSLRQRQAETVSSADATSFMIIWGGSFAVALLVWAMVVINQYYARRQAAEAALQASEAQMRLVTDAMPALIAYLDTNERFRFHNKAFEHWFNRSASAFEGRALRELVGADVYASMHRHLAGVLAGEQVHFNFSYQTDDGKVLDLAAHLVPQRDESGHVTGFFVLVTDISELKRLERLKAEFVATVSHELRTPLTSIRGSLGLLASGVAGSLPEAGKTLVDIARDSCERLVRLINDILDFEKIESGKMSLNPEVIDLPELVERSVRANDGFATSHGVTVRVLVETPGVRVRADSDRLNQVIANLLSNACKFSPPGGVVEVTVARRGALAYVGVSDRGPGIPEAFQSRIFQRFSQADSSDTRHKGGTGLGLAISWAIVERLEGHIGFQAREGGGTTFFFELPEWRE